MLDPGDQRKNVEPQRKMPRRPEFLATPKNQKNSSQKGTRKNQKEIMKSIPPKKKGTENPQGKTKQKRTKKTFNLQRKLRGEKSFFM